jgi:hypothetical protein
MMMTSSGGAGTRGAKPYDERTASFGRVFPRWSRVEASPPRASRGESCREGDPPPDHSGIRLRVSKHDAWSLTRPARGTSREMWLLVWLRLREGAPARLGRLVKASSLASLSGASSRYRP